MDRQDALALLEELIETHRQGGRRQERTLTRFDEGMEPRWFLPVHSAFRSSLDIRDWPSRPSQGALFSFGEGAILYDRPSGYDQAGDARRLVQVVTARPVVLPSADGSRERDPGAVTFDLYALSGAAGGFRYLCRHLTTQDDFLRFMIAGPPEVWPAQVRHACIED